MAAVEPAGRQRYYVVVLHRVTACGARGPFAPPFASAQPVGRYTNLVAAVGALVLHGIVLAAIIALPGLPRALPPAHRVYIYVLPRSGGQSSKRALAALPLRQVPRPPKRLVSGARALVAPLKAEWLHALPVSASNRGGSKLPRSLAKADDPTSGAQNGASGGGSARSPFAGIVQAPLVLSTILPSYPEIARRRGIEGQVMLEIVVDEFGRVEPAIAIMESLPLLDQAAIDAIRQWRFAPARDRDGNPVRAKVRIPLRFTLQ